MYSTHNSLSYNPFNLFRKMKVTPVTAVTPHVFIRKKGFN